MSTRPTRPQREQIIALIQEHVRWSPRDYGLSGDLEGVDDAADAIMTLCRGRDDLLEAAGAAEFMLAALCVDRDSDTRMRLRAAIATAESAQ